MAVCVPALLSKTTPTCRLVSPVAMGMLPPLKIPLGESDDRHRAITLTPSAAFMAGSCTGHRLNGAQSPLSVGNDGKDVPVAADAGLTATRTANAPSAPTILMRALPAMRFETRDSPIDKLPSPPSVICWSLLDWHVSPSPGSGNMGGTPVNTHSGCCGGRRVVSDYRGDPERDCGSMARGPSGSPAGSAGSARRGLSRVSR